MRLVAQLAQYRRDFFFVQRLGKQLRRRLAPRAIHAHIQRAAVFVGEAALGTVKLHRRNAQVGKQEIHALQILGLEHFGDAGKVRVVRGDCQAARFEALNGALLLFGVHIQRNRARYARRNRLRVSPIAKRAIEERLPVVGLERLEHFLEHHGYVRACGRAALRADFGRLLRKARGFKFLVALLKAARVRAGVALAAGWFAIRHGVNIHDSRAMCSARHSYGTCFAHAAQNFNGAKPMRYTILPALLVVLLLAGCGGSGTGGVLPGGVGSSGNPTVLAIVTAEMPNAIQNGYYYAQIRATGGTGPYTWTLISSLPTGLSLTQSSGQVAVIQGVAPNYTWKWNGGAAPPPPPPNTESEFPFGLRISDSAGNTMTRYFLIEVDPATTSRVTTRGITDSTVGCEFSARFNAVGGVAGTYTWAITSGTLPAGLTLANSTVAEAELSGTPTTAGTYNFDVQASDTVGVVGTASCALTVFATGETLRIEPLGATTTFNFNLWPTHAYLSELYAVGGTGGYQWRIISGALPTGLTLYQDGQQHAAIAGTITVQGTFSWQVEVTDQSGNSYTSAITMNIIDQPPP